MSDPIFVIVHGSLPDSSSFRAHGGLEIMNCPSCPRKTSVRTSPNLGGIISDAPDGEPLQVLLFPGLPEADAWAREVAPALRQMATPPRIIADEVSLHAFLDAQIQYVRTAPAPAVSVLVISPPNQAPLDLSQLPGANGSLVLNCPSCPRRTAVHTRCAGLVLADPGAHVQLVEFQDAAQAFQWLATQAPHLAGRRVIPDLC